MKQPFSLAIVESLSNARVKPKMNTKDYFDDAADTWDDRFITSSLLFFLEKFVPQFGIEAGQKVLDVGTGTGCSFRT